MPRKKKPLSPNKVTLMIAPTPPPKKGKPRGKSFAKGNEHAFKPGQSGNPKGRPPITGHERAITHSSKKISEAYAIYLEQRCGLEGYEHLTWGEAIAHGMMRVAVGGDVQAAKELRESTEGKIADKMQLTGKDGQPLNNAPALVVVFTDDEDAL